YYSNGEYTNTPSTTMEVTVPPPDVDTESGVVQYGTKVTISPAHGLRFRYSVNGEEFENPDASNVVITITEDTELLVQSIVDDKEPGVAYLCNTETYMYHLQKYGRIAGKCSPAGASLSLYDSEGNKIDSTIADEEGNYAFENVPPGTGYMLSVFKYGYIVVTYDDITVTAEETVIMNVGAVLGDYTVIITDAQEFKEFADNVNNGQTYEHYEIILDNDIDISTICGEDIDGEEVSWTPIGSEEHPFKGSFSGCGHTVSGLYINTDNESQYLGLFGYAGEKSRITTLTVDGSVEVLGTTYMRPPAASQYQYVGAITGYSAGYISGCHNKAEVYFSGNCGGVGGIAGKLIGENALITGCSNTGNVSAQFTVYGGIAGRVNNHASVTSCYSTGYNMLIETPAKIAASIEMDNGASAEKCYYLAEAEAESDIPGIYAKTTGQFASGEVAYLLGSPWGQKIGVDEYPVYGGDKVYLTDEGYTNTPPTEIHVHKICGDETCPDNHEDITWTAWDSADKLPTEAGNYYLTKDVEISGTWVPADGTNLCLNSHSIIQIDHNRSVISVQGEFSICDCSGIGKITGGYSGVVVASSTFNMYSGEITGNHSTGDVFDGAGVLVLNNGIFNMHGGKISQNTSEIGGIGGGVLCYPDSTFNMSGGEISGNTAGNGGGVSIEINAKMNISGNVVIKDNENAKGETSNVHLVEKSKRITISAPLSDGAYIGVNSTVSPSDGNPVDITDENSADYSGYFHSDSEDYTIVNGDNNVVKLCVRIPTEFSITYHEGEYLVSAPEAGTYTAIIAEYAYDGTLESVTSEEVTFDTPGTKRVFHAKKPGLAYMTKLMLWYGFENMEPCCQSKTVITLVD
ncbi:MAG: carboxypeptidase regulatory-like domain-containing protein, partial [Oscillospiraceae bacterium]|nr:carboxypeptidase regulatory-like domain-containing protein [Oscillospiraceae bacterium]